MLAYSACNMIYCASEHKLELNGFEFPEKNVFSNSSVIVIQVSAWKRLWIFEFPDFSILDCVLGP